MNTGSAELFSYIRTDGTASFCVFYPEFPDLHIFACESKSIIGKWMREAGTVKINSDLSLFCPVYPSLVIFCFYLIPVDKFTSEFSVDSMKVQSLSARYKRQHLIEVVTHLSNCFCFAREITSSLYPSASKLSPFFFESSNIVCLPAVKADHYLIKLSQNSISINPKLLIFSFRKFVCFLNILSFHNCFN